MLKENGHRRLLSVFRPPLTLTKASGVRPDAVISFSSRFGIERRSKRAGFTTELGLSNIFVPFSKCLSNVSWQHKDELDPVLALKE